MNTTPDQPQEPLELALNQFIAGDTELPEFSTALHAGRLYVLAESDPGESGVQPLPLILRNAEGAKLVAVFSSPERAWEWLDGRYQYTFWVTTPNVVRVVHEGYGMVINPASATGVELTPAGVDQLRAGQALSTAEVRVRRGWVG